jgi:Methyltransferase domain
VTQSPVTQPKFDPYLNDPDRWGVSLAQMSELLIPLLDAVGATSVAEIGAFAGDLTRVLVDWAGTTQARVLAIDPSPQPGLIRLEQDSPELELVRQTSLEALPQMPLTDVVIIDGDHNYFTVSEELRLLAARAEGASLPLLLFHDVCWPHGRRDDYFDVMQIPSESRHEVAGEYAGIAPGESGLSPGGLPYPRSSRHEGGERNGVLTAVEDFVATRLELRLAVVPAFFGFGVVWSLRADWADEVARIVDPWDRNPILERLEANRVHQLALRHQRAAELWETQARQSRQQILLERLLRSSAFSIAERLSRLRIRMGIAEAESAVSKDEIRRVLGG